MLALNRIAVAVAVLAVSMSSEADSQSPLDKRERVLVIPLLLCGDKPQWDAATYLDKKLWAGLDTVKLRHIRTERYQYAFGGDQVSIECEAWSYNHDSLRTYSADDASAFARLYFARALLQVRVLTNATGVVADVGVYAASKPPMSGHYISNPHPTAKSALDEISPRIRALLTRAGVLSTR